MSFRMMVLGLEPGADIYALDQAELIRLIDRDYPGWILITEPMFPPPGHERQPYFGAISTRKGLDACGWRPADGS